ncbi:MAG: hypothetical protein EOP48_14975 [Sphingobacteriales bacterium]|nr:MAG: hypothetical protein EOP48_14975 [Sphingobacteriales bacterium]
MKNYSPEAIENLMLTHGWRRFKWEDVLQERQPNFEFLPEMEGHIISGRIIDKNTKQGIAGQNTFLSVAGRRPQLYTSYSNQKGNINFFTKNFSSTAGIVVQTASPVDSLAEIEISSPYSDKFSEYIAKPYKFNYDLSTDLLQRSVAMQVSNAFYGPKLSSVSAPDTDSSSFYMKPDKIYRLDNYVRFKTMEEVLREYVSEIDVEQRKGEYHLNMFDTNAQEYMNSAPLAMIDGVPVFGNANQIIKIDPLKVEILEVVSGRYGYGNNNFPGVASFYTYKGDLAGMKLPQQALTMNYDGLQAKREFYSPMYEGDIALTSRLPDFRSTLLWSPDNRTNKDGTATINFYTSDLTGNYYIVVQALSKDGYSGSQVTGFSVSKRGISQLKE